MLHLTPEILEGAYELLRLTPPFKRWRLPPGDEIEFRATRLSGDDQGECYHRKNKGFCLTVNPVRHHTLAAALMTLAHEMAHIREIRLGGKSPVHNNKLYCRLADQVCKVHGFDRGQF